MKRFLSIILALVILTVPVGATTCFADEMRWIGYDQYMIISQIIRTMTLDELSSENLGKVELIADMNQRGRFWGKFYFYGDDGRLLKIQKLNKGTLIYEEAREYIESNYCTRFGMIDMSNYSNIRLNFTMGTPGHKDIGILTVTAYADVSSKRVTLFYKIFNLKTCPEFIDKLGLWHKLICVYLLFA